MTSFLGLALLVGIPVVALTGFLSNDAYDPRLGCQGHEFEHVFLGGDGCQAFWHSDPKIDHASERKFEGAPSANDFSFIQLHPRHMAERHALAS